MQMNPTTRWSPWWTTNQGILLCPKGTSSSSLLNEEVVSLVVTIELRNIVMLAQALTNKRAYVSLNVRVRQAGFCSLCSRYAIETG